MTETKRELEKLRIELEFKKFEVSKSTAESVQEDDEEEETDEIAAAFRKSKMCGPKLASFEES